MRYHALACDYDGTLAHEGRVDDETLTALNRLRTPGRRLILVTGRQLDELRRVFPESDRFDAVVAENGALLYRPHERRVDPLASAPPPGFVQGLMDRGVEPLSTGRVIVATWRPHERTVERLIREQALPLQVIFNKDAVMVLPRGVDKASGLRAALDALGVSADNVVGVGDAENDLAFLTMCTFSAAVANALASVKRQVDWVSGAERGAGVRELCDYLIATDRA